MSLTSLSPTITTIIRSILFIPLSSNGLRYTLFSYSLSKLTGHVTWSLLTSVVTLSSLFPATTPVNCLYFLDHRFVYLQMRWYQVRYFPIHPYSCIPRLASFRYQRSTKPRFGHILVFVTPAFYFSLNPPFYSFSKNKEDVSVLFCDLTFLCPSVN